MKNHSSPYKFGTRSSPSNFRRSPFLVDLAEDDTIASFISRKLSNTTPHRSSDGFSDLESIGSSETFLLKRKFTSPQISLSTSSAENSPNKSANDGDFTQLLRMTAHCKLEFDSPKKKRGLRGLRKPLGKLY